ncbi:hypothetical protein EVAR_33516_1 [Eumeta japonica]|uniref:Uncharacterized protein n=1 Tax=Eumeta variegata TaxID=151549 RepID=A0A4C1VI46_EUMVA|nr:hypothetical protein EVAR_33516_1 [Eumeta japonica]
MSRALYKSVREASAAGGDSEHYSTKSTREVSTLRTDASPGRDGFITRLTNYLQLAAARGPFPAARARRGRHPPV